MPTIPRVNQERRINLYHALRADAHEHLRVFFMPVTTLAVEVKRQFNTPITGEATDSIKRFLGPVIAIAKGFKKEALS